MTPAEAREIAGRGPDRSQYSKAALFGKIDDAREAAHAASKRATDAATFARELAEKMETAYSTVAKALESAHEARMAQEVAEGRHRSACEVYDRAERFLRGQRDSARLWCRRLALTVAFQAVLGLGYLVWVW